MSAHIINHHTLKTVLSLLWAVSGDIIFPPIPDDLEFKTYTTLTKPIPLAAGQISHDESHRVKIPTGPIAIHEFKGVIVELDAKTGNAVPVPLNEAYLHHNFFKSDEKHHKHLKQKGKYKGVHYLGAGSDAQGTPQAFYYPFAFITREGEDTMIADVHIINTRGMEADEAYKCIECPCTSEYKNANGTFIKQRGRWDLCSDNLANVLGNDSCQPNTYKGGLRCCKNLGYCRERSALPEDGPINTFYIQFTLKYSEVRPSHRPLGLATCCDVTGDQTQPGSVEYDVPQCEDPVNNAENCIYEVSTVQMLHDISPMGAFSALKKKVENRDGFLDVVYIAGHMHRGAIDIELAYEESGEVICLSEPTYGMDQGMAAEEHEYIYAFSTCEFSPPKQISTTTLLKVTARYNSTEPHTGVMGQFYIVAADPLDEDVKEETVVPMVDANATDVAFAAGRVGNNYDTSNAYMAFFLFFTFVVICVRARKKFVVKGKPKESTA